MKQAPDLYHGQLKDSNFFEGWYFKLMNESGTFSLTFIPGISKSITGEQHCFLQIINPVEKTYDYLRFPPDAFYSNPRRLKIHVRTNIFSCDKVCVDIKTKTSTIHGIVYLDLPLKWPDSKFNIGSMGFYNHFSFLECYSHVCALDGLIEQGHLIINGQPYDFKNGRYYIEKSWGSSFPSTWLFLQSNCFLDRKATLTCSLATVPFPLLKQFRGFLIGVTVNHVFYSFTTANRSKLIVSIENNDILLTATNKHYKLTLTTKTFKDQVLMYHGPKVGQMLPLVYEILNSTLSLKLENIKKKLVIYEGVSLSASIKFSGDLLALLDSKQSFTFGHHEYFTSTTKNS